jgi:Phage integrase family
MGDCSVRARCVRRRSGGSARRLSLDGVPVRIGVRNRALLVGYQGALRIEELVRACVEHLDVAAGSYRLRHPEAKTAKRGASQAVLLAAEPGPLDPVAALDEWLAVRGDHDGPLFCTLHHGRCGVPVGGEALTAGEIRDVIGDMAVRAGLTASASGYSLRRSWATHQYLRDPDRLPVISAQLPHSSFDMTAHYIDDLGLHVLDACELLSAESVLAGPGGVRVWRRDLGFDQAALPELLDEVGGLGQSSDRWAPSTVRTNDSYWNTWQSWANESEHGEPGVVEPVRERVGARLLGHRATTGHGHARAVGLGVVPPRALRVAVRWALWASSAMHDRQKSSSPLSVTASTVASRCSSAEAIERMARATPAGSRGPVSAP